MKISEFKAKLNILLELIRKHVFICEHNIRGELSEEKEAVMKMAFVEFLSRLNDMKNSDVSSESELVQKLKHSAKCVYDVDVNNEYVNIDDRDWTRKIIDSKIITVFNNLESGVKELKDFWSRENLELMEKQINLPKGSYEKYSKRGA